MITQVVHSILYKFLLSLIFDKFEIYFKHEALTAYIKHGCVQNLTVVQLADKLYTFMGPGALLPCSQELATGPYPDSFEQLLQSYKLFL
jgi:hypothetical protein